jgi:DNA-directed RNA polymerase specialized sigma24 family protein
MRYFRLLQKNYTHMEDRELLKLLKTRRKAGLELLYEQYGAAVYGIVERLSTTDKVAEELLVDIFLKAWSQAKTLDITKANLLSWLLQLTINTIQEKLSAGTVDKTALQPFPELGQELNTDQEKTRLLQRLEREIRTGLPANTPINERVGDEKLQYSILALRARMQINKALLAK